MRLSTLLSVVTVTALQHTAEGAAPVVVVEIGRVFSDSGRHSGEAGSVGGTGDVGRRDVELPSLPHTDRGPVGRTRSCDTVHVNTNGREPLTQS